MIALEHSLEGQEGILREGLVRSWRHTGKRHL